MVRLTDRPDMTIDIYHGRYVFLFCKALLVRTNFLYPYQMLPFYEIKSFTRALRNTDHEVSVQNALVNGLKSAL